MLDSLIQTENSQNNEESIEEDTEVDTEDEGDKYWWISIIYMLVASVVMITWLTFVVLKPLSECDCGDDYKGTQEQCDATTKCLN